MTSKICEWDQYVILDPEEGIKGKSHKKKFINPSRFYYGSKKYSDINPLESLYEEDEYDYEIEDNEIDDDENINRVIKYICWGEILVKSIFTGCMVYVIFMF
jgi:hypothetical protein